jgi:putative nucleotidyltransferase with HDIG domain
MPARLSVSEMFVFTCALLFGPAPAAVTLAVDGVCFSLRRTLAPHRTLFNAAELALSIWLSSHLFFRLSGLPPLYQQNFVIGDLIVSLIVMTAAYYCTNCSLMATAIRFDTGKPAIAIWRQHFVWLIPNYFAGASVALLLMMGLRQVSFSAIALIPPLLLLFYLTVRSSMGRVEDADRHVTRVNQLYMSTIETLATAIDAKDEVTHGHIRRVQTAAVGLARALGETDPDLVKAIEAAALLHDTGKLAIPEHILNKPGKLTTAEFEIMKQHARIGAEILSPIDFPYPVVPIVRSHHENWDGTGYPDGLAGEAIPIGARILSVVDCFDALRSDRPYRKRMTEEAALAILAERSGTMYDPRVVETFSRVHAEIMPMHVQDELPARSKLAVRTAAVADEAPQLQSEEILALSSLGRALSPEGSLSDTMALIWIHLRAMLPGSMVAFYLSHPDRNEVELVQASGDVPPNVLGITIQNGYGVSGWVASTRRPIVNSEAALDLGTTAPNLQSCLSIPLQVGDGLLGVVTLYCEKTAGYEEPHLRLLEAVAPHIAASLGAALRRTPKAVSNRVEGRPSSEGLRLVSRRSLSKTSPAAAAG